MFENSQVYTEILHSIVGAAVANVVSVFYTVLLSGLSTFCLNTLNNTIYDLICETIEFTREGRFMAEHLGSQRDNKSHGSFGSSSSVGNSFHSELRYNNGSQILVGNFIKQQAGTPRVWPPLVLIKSDSYFPKSNELSRDTQSWKNWHFCIASVFSHFFQSILIRSTMVNVNLFQSFFIWQLFL